LYYPEWGAVVEDCFKKNVAKVTASRRLIIVLGKDKFSFANVRVFLVWGGETHSEINIL
jgi:hypothetical protein